MTTNELWEFCRNHGGYTSCRTELRKMLAQKLNCEVDTRIANLTRAQLFAELADDGGKDDGGEVKTSAGGSAPSPKAEDKSCGAPKPDATPGEGDDATPKADAKPDAKVTEPVKDDPESELKRLHDEAAKAFAEAKRKAEELDRKKREIEEARRKAEEERKRKADEEARKGNRHKNLDELIFLLKTLGTAFLCGPAGSGKTTLALSACKEMFGIKDDDAAKLHEKFAGISFSADTTKGEMIGMKSADGKYNMSDVVRVYGNGGLILFDEVDAASPEMLVKLNTSLANGYMSTPGGMVMRHPDTVIVATANTWGTGGNAMYCGRARLDAATLDRWTCAKIMVDYDANVEKKIISSALPTESAKMLGDFVAKVRKTIATNKLQRLCSTRFVINATKLMAAGKDLEYVKQKFLADWDESQKKLVA